MIPKALSFGKLSKITESQLAPKAKYPSMPVRIAMNMSMTTKSIDTIGKNCWGLSASAYKFRIY